MNEQQRAVVQQALEALNAMLTHMGMEEDDWNKVTFDQMRNAITALRQLIEQPAAWVGLMDEQIYAIGKELGMKCRLGGNPNIDIDYARAIEAKLKEKNT
jgi:hypothetical protein